MFGLTENFPVQGSESLASWQANLLFEPVQFEVNSFFDYLLEFARYISPFLKVSVI